MIERTLADWTAEHITMKAEPISARPDGSPGDFLPGTFHFLVTLTYADKRYVSTYSMGPGHGKPGRDGRIVAPKPDAADVLGSLLMDAGYPEDLGDALDFAAEMGYDLSDAKQRVSARLTWAALMDMAPKLRAWLGDAYEYVQGLDKP